MPHISSFKMFSILLICFSAGFDVLFGLSDTYVSFSKTNVCRNNDHLNGEWVYNEARGDSKSFICCAELGRISETSDICSHSFNGVLDNSSLLLNDLARGNACTCDHKQGIFGVNRAEMHDWVPENCSLIPWNSHLFCELLGSRTLLLVGDSTMSQTFATLTNMIKTNSSENCHTQVFVGNSDYLAFPIKHFKDWMTYSEAVDADIVILNSGPHLHDVGDHWHIWKMLVPQILDAREKKPGMKVVWKTSNPPHLDCRAEQKPMLKYTNISIGDPRDRYGWYSIELGDGVARRNCAENNITLLDMSPLYLRADAHPKKVLSGGYIDCLHFCTPGPLNLFSQLLMNMLYTGEI